MVLTISIGNSNITIGGYKGKDLVFVSDIISDARRTKDQYMVDIKSIAGLYDVKTDEIDGAIIGSVVPELTPIVSEAVAKLCKITPVVVGPGIKSGLNIRIENPTQLGADIFAGAVAALDRFSGPIIICNLGTATVMSVINSQNIFSGVIIAAGIGTTLDGFTKRTALLPHVNVDVPKSIIGKNSVQSVQSGLIFGTAAMIDGLIERIEEELGCEAKVIATGKMCKTISDCCKRKIELYEYLILDGLKILYDKNC